MVETKNYRINPIRLVLEVVLVLVVILTYLRLEALSARLCEASKRTDELSSKEFCQ
jgi:hypothetical protein